MKKCIFSILSAIILCGSLVSCGVDNSNEIEVIVKKGTVKIINNDVVTIQSPIIEDVEGTTVVLNIQTKSGYQVDQVFVNNAPINATNNFYSFSLSEGENVVTSTYKKLDSMKFELLSLEHVAMDENNNFVPGPVEVGMYHGLAFILDCNFQINITKVTLNDVEYKSICNSQDLVNKYLIPLGETTEVSETDYVLNSIEYSHNEILNTYICKENNTCKAEVTTVPPITTVIDVKTRKQDTAVTFYGTTSTIDPRYSEVYVECIEVNNPTNIKKVITYGPEWTVKFSDLTPETEYDFKFATKLIKTGEEYVLKEINLTTYATEYSKLTFIHEDYVSVYTAENKYVNGEYVTFTVDILDDRFELAGFNSREVSPLHSDIHENEYSFIMPPQDVTIEIKCVYKNLVGTYFGEVGVSEDSSNNNLLYIEDDFSYKFIRNNDYAHPILGKLTLDGENFVNEDKSLTLLPIVDDNNNLSLFGAHYIDLETNHHDYLVFSKDSYIEVLDKSPLFSGALIICKTNTMVNPVSIDFQETYVHLVEFKNFDTALNTSTIYELVYNNETIYLKHDGKKLYQNTILRGVYKNISYVGIDATLTLDGFGCYHYLVDTNDEFRKDFYGDYYYDRLLSFVNIYDSSDNNKLRKFSIDLENKTVNEYGFWNTFLTGMNYVFNFKSPQDESPIEYHFGLGQTTLGSTDLPNLKVYSYKATDTTFDILFNNDNIVSFKLDRLSYKMKQVSGFIYEEGDANSIEIIPEFIQADIDMGNNITYHFENGHYIEVIDGREYFSSTHLEWINGKLYVAAGFETHDQDLREYMDLDLEHQTGVRYTHQDLFK